jgi:hypothetical protein
MTATSAVYIAWSYISSVVGVLQLVIIRYTHIHLKEGTNNTWTSELQLMFIIVNVSSTAYWLKIYAGYWIIA